MSSHAAILSRRIVVAIGGREREDLSVEIILEPDIVPIAEPPPVATETALAAIAEFTEYEERALDEIAAHIVSPNFVRQVLSRAGKPVEKVLDYAMNSRIRTFRRASDLVTRGVHKALEAAVVAASKISSDERVLKTARSLGMDAISITDLKSFPLEDLDRLADRFDAGHAVALGIEGAALGAATTITEGIPFAQVMIPAFIAFDVSASMTLLSRHVGCVAASYGFSPRHSGNRFHVIAAMAPPSDSPEEGYFAAKLAAVESIREAGIYMARKTGVENMLQREAPRLVQLLNFVAAQLGLVLTEKELGMLVPLAGAVINSALNVAFQKTGHISSKDYFRLMHLEQKYGDAAVRRALTEAVAKVKRPRPDAERRPAITAAGRA